MEAWDAIRARRNVREYTSEPVSDDDLNRIAEAGWRAPSAKNRQAWDFVIVTDKGQLQELSTVWRGAGHIAGAAAAIAFVIPEPPDERRRVTDQYDVGQATMAIMLAATVSASAAPLATGSQTAWSQQADQVCSVWLAKVKKAFATPVTTAQLYGFAVKARSLETGELSALERIPGRNAAGT